MHWLTILIVDLGVAAVVGGCAAVWARPGVWRSPIWPGSAPRLVADLFGYRTGRALSWCPPAAVRAARRGGSASVAATPAAHPVGAARVEPC